MSKIIKIFILMFLLCGCATHQEFDNFLAPDLSDEMIFILSKNMTELIAEDFNKETNFFVAESRFGTEIAGQLNKKGYKISFNLGKNEEQKIIRYIIDMFEQNQLYVSLTVNNNQRYTILYDISHGEIIVRETIKGKVYER